jgi:PilZ domain-containing protein
MSISPGKRNLRRHTRETIKGSLRILWEDAEGREHVSRASLVDISPSGIGLRSDEAIPLRSPISCNDETLGIRGRGTVRHCTYVKGKYQIGVEFSGGTGWRELAVKIEAGSV